MTTLTPNQIRALNNLGGGFPPNTPLGDLLNALLESDMANTTLDAFGRLRVSNPETVFENKQVLNDGVPTRMAAKLVGTGTRTYENAKARSVLALNGGGTDRVVYQSRSYINYFPGKSQLVDVTFNLNGPQAGAIKRAGLFDDNNGLFIEQSPTQLSLVIRSKTSGSVVDTKVAQADWNVDPLDGTGPSGVVLDTTKVQVFTIDFQWLGTGRVRWGFFFDDIYVPVHISETANVGTVVYMSTPLLPVRYEIVASAAGSTGTMDAICCTVASEGGTIDRAQYRSASRGTTTRGVNNQPKSLISLRLRDATKRGSVFLEALSVVTKTNPYCLWQVVVGGTFGAGTAPSWTAVPGSDLVEYDVTRDQVYNDDGVVIGSGYFSAAIDEAQVVAGMATRQVPPLTMDVDGVADEVHLIVRNADSTATDQYWAALRWLEQY